MGAAINLATGKVVLTPSDLEFNALEFQPNSRLIVFAGLRGEEEQKGAHYYEFDGREFRFLMTIPDDGTFLPRLPAHQMHPRQGSESQAAHRDQGSLSHGVLLVHAGAFDS